MNGAEVRPEKFRPDSLRKTKNSLKIRKAPAQAGGSDSQLLNVSLCSARIKPMLSVTRQRRLAVLALLATGAAASIGSVSAQEPTPDPARGEAMVRAARGAAPERSLSDAVRRVQRTTGGHILGAERVPYDGRDINRVKYMDDRGRVRYMDDPVPARSQPRAPRSDMSSLRGDNP